MSVATLTKAIGQIKSQDDFFNAPAAVACWYAYTLFKQGKWDRPQFDKSLRLWWRKNHPLRDDEKAAKEYLDMVQATFIG